MVLAAKVPRLFTFDSKGRGVSQSASNCARSLKPKQLRSFRFRRRHTAEVSKMQFPAANDMCRRKKSADMQALAPWTLQEEEKDDDAS